MRRACVLIVCLWVAGCAFHRDQATPDEAASGRSTDTQSTPEDSPALAEDPTEENPVREVTGEDESQRPIANDFQREPGSISQPDPLIEALFSSWTDAQLIDLLFPDSGFRRGPEFLDGGPNTLYRTCIYDGTPEFLCRQRYAP